MIALLVLLGLAYGGSIASPAGCPGTTAPVNVLTFHGDPGRRGWNACETELTAARVESPAFGPLWSSPRLDPLTLDGREYAPRLYATPLYVDRGRATAGACRGRDLSLVLAASSNGWVYAVNARAQPCGAAALPAGAIVWRARLGTPAVAPGLDGGVPVGVLSTPVIDLAADPPRIYAVAMDALAGWQVFALNMGDGRVLPGWPVGINGGALAPVNRNGPARFAEAREMAQRGALNLSPMGDLLYVTFGSYRGLAPGWIVAVGTRTPRLQSAFASAPDLRPSSNGGIWSAGGPAVDVDGRVFATTGNSPGDSREAPGVWGSSLLQWSPSLALMGTYTPFNYCVLDRHNMDLGGSSPMLLPPLEPSRTRAPRLVAFGGKQGTVYLVDRDHLPGRLDRRPPCRTDASTDPSLLPPDSQPQYGRRGPLNVFGPYTDVHAELNHARMRTTPAYFRDSGGTSYLFVTGSTKAAHDSPQSVPPGLLKLRVPTGRDGWASLAVDRQEMYTTFLNPGSPTVTSAGPRGAIVWVLDANMPRLTPLTGPSVPRPVLHAFDGVTLRRLWRSAPGDLEPGGKYSSPTIARGVVFVGTDRIQAFGLRGGTSLLLHRTRVPQPNEVSVRIPHLGPVAPVRLAWRVRELDATP